MADPPESATSLAPVSPVRVAFRVAAFRRFLVAQAVAQTATWLHRVALVWVAVEASSGHGTIVGTMTALQFAPLAVATVIGGRLGDRFDRRPLLVRTQLAVVTICAGLAVIDSGGVLPVPIALAGAALLGVLAGIDTPIRLAHVPSLVSRDIVRSATSMNTAAFNVAKLAGPAIAGALIAWTDTAIVFGLTSVLALVAAWLLWRLPGPEVQSEFAQEAASLRLALRVVRQRLDLRLPLFLGLVFGAAAANLQVVIPLMATQEFARDAAGYGVLTAALAVGSLLGAMSSAVRHPRSATRELLWLMSAMVVVQALAAVAPGFLSFGSLLIAAGAALLAGNTASLSILQVRAPQGITSRIIGVYVLAYFLWSPVGGPLLGAISDAAGPRVAVGFSALLCLAGLVVAVAMVQREPADDRQEETL